LEKKPKQMGKRQSEALSFFVFLHSEPLRSSQRSFFSFPQTFSSEQLHSKTFAALNEAEREKIKERVKLRFLLSLKRKTRKKLEVFFLEREEPSDGE
jgi:hypothetical protein